MTELAAKYGLTLIESKTNTISLAMTLEQQVKMVQNKSEFQKLISGCRSDSCGKYVVYKGSQWHQGGYWQRQQDNW